MQNKNISLLTNHSAPSQRYYRSVRYKVSSTAPHDASNMTKMGRTTSTWKKTHLPRSNFTTNTQKAINPELADEDSVQLKQPYLTTWRNLLQSSKIDSPVKVPRVHLPHVIEYSPSVFTSLDPLPLPFQHIQQCIDEVKSKMPAPQIQMAQIRSDLRHLSSRITKDLQDTKQIASKGFQKLRKMLRTDQVEFQEAMMRYKRNCIVLSEEDQKFTQNLEVTKPRLTELQLQIFSTRPFDLEHNPTLAEQFPQDYF